MSTDVVTISKEMYQTCYIAYFFLAKKKWQSNFFQEEMCTFLFWDRGNFLQSIASLILFKSSNSSGQNPAVLLPCCVWDWLVVQPCGLSSVTLVPCLQVWCLAGEDWWRRLEKGMGLCGVSNWLHCPLVHPLNIFVLQLSPPTLFIFRLLVICHQGHLSLTGSRGSNETISLSYPLKYCSQYEAWFFPKTSRLNPRQSWLHLLEKQGLNLSGFGIFKCWSELHLRHEINCSCPC